MYDVSQKLAHETKFTDISKYRFIVLPNSRFRTTWDTILLVLLTYVALFTPFQIALLGAEHTYPRYKEWFGFFLLDRLIDFFFLADICINFRSPWYSPEGHVVFNQKLATSRYLRSWFFLDFFSLLPFDAVGLFFSGNTAALRFPKLLKIARLTKLMKMLRASRTIRRLEQNINVKYGIIRLCKFFVAIILVGHWLGCGLNLSHDLSNYDPELHCVSDGSVSIQSWVDTLYCSGECDHDNVFVGGCTTYQKYLTSIHWAIMTLTTIGYGDISPQNESEMIYVIFGMLIGAGFFSYVLGSCCSLVDGLDAMAIKFQEQLDTINTYMEICSIPKTLRHRIRAYIWNKKMLNQKSNERQVLGLMSPALKHEVLLYNYGKDMRRIELFSDVPPLFIVLAADIIQHKLFGPRDIITMQGILHEPFYIMVKGEITVFRGHEDRKDLQIIKVFRTFGYWNERVLVYDSPADVSVRAQDFVETYSFEGRKMRLILCQFPGVHQKVRRAILRMLFWFTMRRAVKKISKDSKRMRLLNTNTPSENAMVERGGLINNFVEMQ